MSKISVLKPKLPKVGKVFKTEYGGRRKFIKSSIMYESIKTSPELKWLKHQRKVFSDQVEVIADNYPLSLSWHFYKTELVKIGKSSLIDKYGLDYAIYSQDELKEVSNYAFYNGFEDYQYLVGIDTLYGWRKEVDDDMIKEKIKNWVNNDFKPNYKGSEIEFNNKFREHIRKTLRWKENKQRMKTTARDFCANIAAQGTTGSAFDPITPKANIKVVDEETGSSVKFKKNKYTKSAALSTSTKLKRLFAMRKQSARVSHKVEFVPKVRIIVSSDYNTTMKMRFIDEWLTPWLSGLDKSTLFQTTSQTFQMWRKFSENGRYYNVPIDQSAFDHHVTKKMVLIMLEEIRSLILDFAIDNNELLDVMDTLIYGIDGGEIIYETKDGKFTWEYKSGILSGWQWTALLDTLANIAEYEIMCDLIREEKIQVETVQFNAQGDDGLVKLTKPVSCLALIVAYNQCGFEVHPRKTFISKKHNEYLRKYSKNNEVNGYPARMVTKLLWVYPGDLIPISEVEKLTTTLSKWKMFNERMKGDNKNLLRYLKIEYHGLKIPVATYEKYLYTSQVRGGAGLLGTETSDTMLIEKSENFKKLEIINDVGFNDFRLRFGKYQDREMKKWFSNLITITDRRYMDNNRDEVKFESSPILTPYNFTFIRTNDKPTTDRNQDFPPSVVFGQSKELMLEVFPNINTFVEQSRAPKGWIYDYLTGKLKTVSPRVEGFSDEFSSLLFNDFKASLINSMYYKKVVPDKWDRLNLFAERMFNTFVHSTYHSLPNMF